MKTEISVKKTKVFNVVILDRSGSMESIRKAAVDGFNETLAGIKQAQQKFANTQEHYVSLVTFCSCHTDKVYDKTPISETKPLELKNYKPCCCTPLYDAMGSTITDMKKYVEKIKKAVVVVTIITDGYENASFKYTGAMISEWVGQLRKEGWTFTYMGANQNAVEVANDLNIRNAYNFDYSDEGISDAMDKDTRSRMALYDYMERRKHYYGNDYNLDDLAFDIFNEMEEKETSDEKPDDRAF